MGAAGEQGRPRRGRSSRCCTAPARRPGAWPSTPSPRCWPTTWPAWWRSTACASWSGSRSGVAATALADFSHPGGHPAVVDPDVVTPPRDALEPVEEPGGLGSLQSDFRPQRLHLAPGDVDRAVLEPPSENLAHQDLAPPVGGSVSSLSDDRPPSRYY